MANLTKLVMNYVLAQGAIAAGIVSKETLAGGPPSTDLEYVLPKAKSAVVFALPLNQDKIEAFLAKKDRLAHEQDNIATNAFAGGISLQLSKFLGQKGIECAPIAPNDVYRTGSPRGAFDMLPDISLRYLAARAGVGVFGKSGNLLHPQYGAAIILGAMVTQAELEPTPPLANEENYCDDCGLCIASCCSGLMEQKEETRVEFGGERFSYSKRRDYLRCEYVCGGFTGLHPSGSWSTWSPGRFTIPETDQEFLPAIMSAAQAYYQWPDMGGGYYHSLMKGKLWLTCGNCQLICHPDQEVRTKRFKTLTNSGVIVQNEDGTLEAMSAPEAKARIKALGPEQRALYE